jgi:hypothetical protein
VLINRPGVMSYSSQNTAMNIMVRLLSVKIVLNSVRIVNSLNSRKRRAPTDECDGHNSRLRQE